MILNPTEQTADQMRFSCKEMHFGDSAKVLHKRVFGVRAIDPEKPQLEIRNRQNAAKTSVRAELPSCQSICVNTHLCDALGLADFSSRKMRSSGHTSWEVLTEVGVDGVGGVFPFSRVFLFAFRFSLLFFAFLCFFLRFSPKARLNNCKLLENWNFHSDPVCTDPVQNFPNVAGNRRKSRESRVLANFHKGKGLFTGPNFTHPHPPPTPENTLLRVGGV